MGEGCSPGGDNETSQCFVQLHGLCARPYEDWITVRLGIQGTTVRLSIGVGLVSLDQNYCGRKALFLQQQI